MNKKQKQQKPQSLVGRQVYFKLSKKALAASGIINLTPGKLYTVIRVVSEDAAIIKDDAGRESYILLGKSSSTGNPWCAYLDEKAHWILKRRAPSNG